MSHNRNILDKEFYPEAKSLAKQYIEDFAASVLLQAKLVTLGQKADDVLRNHIDQARKIILRMAIPPGGGTRKCRNLPRLSKQISSPTPVMLSDRRERSIPLALRRTRCSPALARRCKCRSFLAQHDMAPPGDGSVSE